MRSRIIACILIAVVALGLTGCGGIVWEEYNSTNGGFTVLMPGAPAEGIRVADIETYPMDVYSISVGNIGVACVVLYSDYPQVMVDETGVEEMLENACAVTIVDIEGGTLNSQTSITYSSYSGRALKFTKITKYPNRPDVITEVRIRIYMVGNRLYQVMIETVPDSIDSLVIDEYFDSFELV